MQTAKGQAEVVQELVAGGKNTVAVDGALAKEAKTQDSISFVDEDSAQAIEKTSRHGRFLAIR